ncbi:MAG: HNH endonuclease [Elusimicrobiota bacterium]
MRKHGIGKKEIFKRIAGKCHICSETEYALLDVHRIIPGSQGGKYTRENSVCICVNCHRLHHTNSLLTILGWVHSTKGRLLHFVDKEGNEQFI